MTSLMYEAEDGTSTINVEQGSISFSEEKHSWLVNKENSDKIKYIPPNRVIEVNIPKPSVEDSVGSI